MSISNRLILEISEPIKRKMCCLETYKFVSILVKTQSKQTLEDFGEKPGWM